MLRVLFLHALLFYTTCTSCIPGANEMARFRADGIVPDLLDVVPPNQLLVRYYGMQNMIMCPGEIVKPSATKDPPIAISYPVQSGALYSLLMYDPDAPSRGNPKFGPFLHWKVVNIPGNDIEKGLHLTEYIGAGPGPEGGLHRYVFLVYKQTRMIPITRATQVITSMSSQGRAMQKARDFAALPEIGELVAGTFFFSEFDNYVPKLYDQLGVGKK